MSKPTLEQRVESLETRNDDLFFKLCETRLDVRSTQLDLRLVEKKLTAITKHFNIIYEYVPTHLEVKVLREKGSEDGN